MKKNNFTRIKFGLIKGFTTTNLPKYILEGNKKPLLRIFIVLGGISTLLLITKRFQILGEYKKTGFWPSFDTIVPEVSKNSLSPMSNMDLSAIINNMIDIIFKNTMQFIQPVAVQGHLDDLIGQRMFIEVVLLVLCISLLLLFIFFIVNIVIIINKDKIIERFNNRFISLYLRYQVFLSKITLIYVPILFLTGLFTLGHGLHWLITHPIPYENLGLDLHQYVSSSCGLGIALNTKINYKNNIKNPLFFQNKLYANIKNPFFFQINC